MPTNDLAALSKAYTKSPNAVSLTLLGHALVDEYRAGRLVPVGQRDKAEALLCQRTNEYIEALARAEAAEAEVRRLDYSTIHTCWDECPRLPCAQRREIAALTAQLAEARESERAAMTEVNACKDALAQAGGTFERDDHD